MRLVFSTGASAAAAALFCTVAFAQTTGQPSSQPQSPSASSSQQEQQVTIIGCVQREADYRRAKDAGRGGVAGSGVGAGNEFVLVNASMSSESERASASPAETPTGTAGGAGKAFELTGPNEGQLEQHIGRRVEITGKLKPAEAGASGPTGGPTAGTPPSGVDVTSKDLKLRELEVTSVRASSGTCPSQ